MDEITFFSDVSLDIETLGTQPGAMITQIGVALFNRTGSPETHTASWNLALEPQQALGFTVEVATLQWWLRQSAEARDSWANAPTTLPSDALRELSTLIQHRCIKPTLWANSPSFDFVMLAPFWRRAKIEQPWKFYMEADVRTLKLVAPAVPKRTPALAHNAASDAEAQALYVRDVFAHLNKSGA